MACNFAVFMKLINDLFYIFDVIEAAQKCVSKSEESSSPFKELRTVACGLLAVCAVATASPVIAASQVKKPALFSASV